MHLAPLGNAQRKTETEKEKIEDNSKIDRKKNIDRRGPRQIGTDWHIPDPSTLLSGCRLPLRSGTRASANEIA